MIPQALLEEWKVYDELEPDLVERSDWNFAHIVQVLARGGKTLNEYVLPFGDRPSMKVAQPVAYQEMLIDAWISTSNAVHQQKRDGKISA